MTTPDLVGALNSLGIRGLAAVFDDFLAAAIKQRLSPVQLFEELVRIEKRDRARRSLERRQARSRIGTFKPMADFDWNWPKIIDRPLVERSLRLDFVDEGANLIVVGAHGLGKTMLMKNVAHQAVLAGHTVLFVTAAKMLGELAAIDSPSKLEQRIRHYAGIRLLCVDELGYLSYDNRAADLLFEIVSRRYNGHKPIALTTNLAFKDWTTVFPHATCTIALVDRITHRADIIKIEGQSWRRKEAQERQARNR
jgi:DNA replication protein DnaC